jgi:hypothetical protein
MFILMLPIVYLQQPPLHSYPIIYSILVLPLSVVRWLQFTNNSIAIGSEATFIVMSLHELSGFLNVLLLMITRPDSILFGKEINPDGHGMLPASPRQSTVALNRDGSPHDLTVHREEANGATPMIQLTAAIRGENGPGVELGRLPTWSDEE